MFTPYPMPDLVIKKVETFGTGKQDGFNFADCNGTLFEWNDKVDALKGECRVKESVVLYPSITAEFLGVALMWHITPFKEEFKPHAWVKDAAAHNTSFGPVALAGVDVCTINANPDKIDVIANDDGDIIHGRDIHPNQHPAQKISLWWTHQTMTTTITKVTN